jgi:hypothetical protein
LIWIPFHKAYRIQPFHRYRVGTAQIRFFMSRFSTIFTVKKQKMTKKSNKKQEKTKKKKGWIAWLADQARRAMARLHQVVTRAGTSHLFLAFELTTVS